MNRQLTERHAAMVVNNSSTTGRGLHTLRGRLRLSINAVNESVFSRFKTPDDVKGLLLARRGERGKARNGGGMERKVFAVERRQSPRPDGIDEQSQFNR
jgi:hypothetical protein